MTQSYDEHLEEALNEVNMGENLRFINFLYRTKEVCLIAIENKSTYAFGIDEFGSVPMGNLDYVVEFMKEVMKNDPDYLEDLRKVYIRKKEQEKQPGYYGKFESYQDMLNHYKVDNYDDMIRQIYNNNFS